MRIRQYKHPHFHLELLVDVPELSAIGPYQFSLPLVVDAKHSHLFDNDFGNSAANSVYNLSSIKVSSRDIGSP